MEANYPPARRAAGVSAQVTVRIVVGADGLPRDTRVVASTDSAFDAPTLQAVKLLRFSPARVGGRAVQVHVQVPIYWQTLSDTKPPAPSALPARRPLAATDHPAPLIPRCTIRE
nr:energy transducer TonB [Longimicrobium terrae]